MYYCRLELIRVYLYLYLTSLVKVPWVMGDVNLHVPLYHISQTSVPKTQRDDAQAVVTYSCNSNRVDKFTATSRSMDLMIFLEGNVIG